jgi:prepilin-type N-terminal cleavage/methylation domain-containing protein
VLPTPCPETTRRAEAGFSIIELMIVLTIVGILASFAIPAFDNLIKDSRRTATVNELVGTFMVSRAEAAKRGQPVVVCPVAPTASTACSASTNWSVGWVAFVDINGDSAYDAASDILLRKYSHPYSGIALTLTNTSTPSGVPATVVRIASFNQTGSQATIKACDQRGTAYARATNVSAIGRAEVSTLTVDGAALTCP